MLLDISRLLLPDRGEFTPFEAPLLLPPRLPLLLPRLPTFSAVPTPPPTSRLPLRLRRFLKCFPGCHASLSSTKLGEREREEGIRRKEGGVD